MTSARTTLIAGNWKMNGLRSDSEERVNGLVGQISGQGAAAFEMLVCPPAPLLGAVVDWAGRSGIKVGAQDCHTNESGAHTGDTSAQMLADIGCSHVIVGHSERRTDHGETDDLVNAKAGAAHAAGLVAIICVGETEAERDAGDTMKVVGAQVAGSVPDGATAANTVVAYEPVWAIGTGKTPTPDDAQDVHAFIRGELEGRFGSEVAAGMRILYGGSMKPDNAAELLALADVDGGLIGGASLKWEDFWAIAEACPD
jgi:triosephosphate isomerase